MKSSYGFVGSVSYGYVPVQFDSTVHAAVYSEHAAAPLAPVVSMPESVPLPA
jgi:hypothetical protein